jgi:hypothetical protein
MQILHNFYEFLAVLVLVRTDVDCSPFHGFCFIDILIIYFNGNFFIIGCWNCHKIFTGMGLGLAPPVSWSYFITCDFKLQFH